MTGNSRGQCCRALKRLLLITAAMPLVACSSVPMPGFIDTALPGVFAPDSMIEPMEGETDTEEMVMEEEEAITVSSIPQSKDIVKPEIFQATDMAMWDGRPTIGDIWVSVPDAIQPERVMIRNEQTGLEIKGAMFVRTDAPTNTSAPIQLSPGAARALGVAPMEVAKISVTAIRKAPEIDETKPIIARSDTGPTAPRLAAPRPLAQDIPIAPIVSFLDPYLQPSANEDGYVEVAQAVDPDGAFRVQSQLVQAAIPAEIQEDFVEGRSVFRVFASAGVDHDALGGTLEDIRFAGAEGSDDGTLIAEMPNFNVFEPTLPKATAWVAMGSYQSRNEAMSVIQKMARKSIPGEICTATRGESDVFRVFAGPALDKEKDFGSDGAIEAAHAIENKSFCIGVAAAEAANPVINTRPARAPVNDERAPEPPLLADGAVRIRVGEATGSLKLRIPNPYSQPVQIPVGDIMMSLPTNTPPELVAKIRDLMTQLDVEPTQTQPVEKAKAEPTTELGCNFLSPHC